jgi:hypothetical protein
VRHNHGPFAPVYVLLYFSPLYAFLVLAEKLSRFAVLAVFTPTVLDIVNVRFCPALAARAFDIAMLRY